MGLNTLAPFLISWLQALKTSTTEIRHNVIKIPQM